MPTYGYSLMCEAKAPRALVEEARKAEAAGFDFVTISDHIHPWLYSQQHSGFAWSILGSIVEATERIRLATMVTCPTFRYHPVIVAQAAATVAVLSEGRFVLGLGAGERLNEHVVGAAWPSIDERHERLAEAIDIITLLHGGGYASYHGDHYDAEDVRIFDLPDQPMEIFAAASGVRGAALAAEAGVGLCNTAPDPEPVAAFVSGGGDAAATWSQVGMAWAGSVEDGLAAAHEGARFMAPGWKVMAELPNPINFEAATRFVRPEDLSSSIPAGPDPERHVQAIRESHDAGYHNVAVMYPGDDLDGFMRFWSEEVRPRL